MGSRSPNRVKIGARGVAPAGTTEVLIYVGCGTCNAGSQGIYDSIRFWRSARPNSGDLIFERSMVYGFGGLVSEERPEGPVYVQGDQVGSPNILTNASGAVVGRSKNLPFGERFGSAGYRSNRRYTNHEETEDYAIYMQARTYLPAYGKFAQVDPAYDQTKDDPESWNLYNYVTNNPITHTDPDGRETEKKDEKKSGKKEEKKSVDPCSPEGVEKSGVFKPTNGNQRLLSKFYTLFSKTLAIDGRTKWAYLMMVNRGISVNVTFMPPSGMISTDGRTAYANISSSLENKANRESYLAYTAEHAGEPDMGLNNVSGENIVREFNLNLNIDAFDKSSPGGSDADTAEAIAALGHEIGGHAMQWLSEYWKMLNHVNNGNKSAYERPAYNLSYSILKTLSNQPWFSKNSEAVLGISYEGYPRLSGAEGSKFIME